MDDVAAERSPASDADLLAGLRGRRGSAAHAFLAVPGAALGFAYAGQGNPVLAALWGAVALGWVLRWWADPRPRVREVTDDALRVRQGVRTRSIARSQIEDVQPTYSAGYGLVLTLCGTEPLRLAGTALRFSVAAAQAAALRRWAGHQD